jgi:hypothetical protein
VTHAALRVAFGAGVLEALPVCMLHGMKA